MPTKILSQQESLAQIQREQRKQAESILSDLLFRNNIVATDSQATMQAKLCGVAPVLAELDRFITNDSFMGKQKDLVKILAPLDDEVIITGPTGTGKEIIAQALAAAKSGPFMPLNCAAFNETLIESELFGHVKGAFTDAKEKHLGLLRSAENGTVYLDEIDKMPSKIQPKFLRAIQEKEVRPVGECKYYPISCRFICSSKKPVDDLLGASGFLEDLYARLSTFEVICSPLTDRWNDVGLLLDNQLVPKEAQILNEEWRKQIERFNVRAVLKFARRYHIITKRGYNL
jgi:DNA-binding NtrC family response regulator